MSCKDLIQVVPTVTTFSGSASELRYRLLMAALESYPESAPPSEGGVVDAVPAKPASAPSKPKRSRR